MPNLSLIGTQSLAPDVNVEVGAGSSAGREVLSALGGLASSGANLYDHHQDEKARVWAGSAASDFHVRQMEATQTLRQSAVDGVANGQPVPDMTGSFLQDYDKGAESLISSAPSTRAKQYLRQQLTATRTSLGDHVMGQQAQLEREWKLTTATTTADNGAKIVQQDPTQFDAQMGNIMATMPHIDPVTDQQHALRAKAQLTNAAATSVLDNNPYALRDATDRAMGAVDPTTGKPFSGPTGAAYVDAATPEQVHTWNGLAKAEIRRREAAAASGADQREAEAVKAYNELVPFVNTGQTPSLDYVNRVQTAVKGTSQEASANALLQTAIHGGGFGAMTIPRQTATLAALEANGTAAGSDPQREATLAQFRTIHAEQVKAYSANPWQAFTQFGHGPPQPEQQITAPEQGIAVIQARKPLMGAVENASGATSSRAGISPLQPVEAAAWADTLAGIPVARRAEVLGVAGSNLSAPQINALAEQIDAKDKPTALMLKINDRTVSGRAVAERVGIGAQALKDGTVQADTQKLAGWRAEIAGMVRGTLGDTKAEDDLIDAAYYVRAAADSPAGTTPGYAAPDKSALAAVTMVAGMPITRGGVNTILPRGFTESMFDAKLRAMTPDVLKTMAPDGKVYMSGHEVPLNILHNRLVDYGMRYYSPGVYAPVRGNTMIYTDKAGTKPLLLKVQ